MVWEIYALKGVFLFSILKRIWRTLNFPSNNLLFSFYFPNQKVFPTQICSAGWCCCLLFFSSFALSFCNLNFYWKINSDPILPKRKSTREPYCYTQFFLVLYTVFCCCCCFCYLLPPTRSKWLNVIDNNKINISKQPSTFSVFCFCNTFLMELLCSENKKIKNKLMDFDAKD